MDKRRGKSSDRISLKVTAAVCVVSFIAGVAYTKADRTMTLLSTVTTEPEIGRVGLASPVSQPKAVEPNQPTNHGAFGDTALSTRHAARNTQPGQWRTVKMRVTGYCPCPKCCGQYSDGITANGHKIQRGDTFVAADKRYGFGTEMLIPGYNNGQAVKVLDRGGAIRGNKLDAFFHTHQAALEWGVKHLDVKVRGN
ncbi:MAG: 3D domain-containing protein [Planctomycetota bacterium]